MRPVLLLTAATVVAAVAACGGSPTTAAPALTPGDHEHTVTVDGRERSYVVHVPAGLQAARRAPVVIVLHGGGGNARNAVEQTGMNQQADRGGFLAVYPDGTGRRGRALLTWNAGHCCGHALDHRVDDVAFIATLIDRLERDYAGDPRRIYVTGMSNGAMLSYRIACELADRIAAIAPVAGSMGIDCRPSAPVSVVAFHGTADQHVPYRGGTPQIQADPHPRQDPPVADTMSFWADHNHCASPVTQDVSTDTTRQVHTCPDGVEVTLYTIDGGQHAWPGGQTGRAGADRPTTTVSATHLIWEFFQQHPRTT